MNQSITSNVTAAPVDLLFGVNPATGEKLQPGQAVDPISRVAEVCQAAEAAFDAYRAVSLDRRAAFLERIADEIIALGDALIDRAVLESGLPRARLEGERGRTVGQLRLFAEVVRAGHWLGLRVDPAMPERKPLPKPDLRLRMIPLGPVAVFGASNFPLAFSTAGGDTASALAAGCPVVVKGHPAHPGTSAMVASAIEAAVQASGLPAGTFAHLTGASNELGAALVKDPRIAAVGFTGSRAGGLALVRLAQMRQVPIPVYAEMSSINPVLLMPSALAVRGAALGEAFVGSLTMGAGQFCTNPGLVLAIEGPGLNDFIAAASATLGAVVSAPMLTPGIYSAYKRDITAISSHPQVQTLALSVAGEGPCSARAALFEVSAEAFSADPVLAREMFGAAAVLVRCRDDAEMRAVLQELEGQLTATLHADPADESLTARLLPVLERKVGRILANGWPTGVEVTHAMVHGGPYPATSDARGTSVGSLAIDRFLRPVSYQNLPSNLLPPELRDDASSTVLPRLVNGAPIR